MTEPDEDSFVAVKSELGLLTNNGCKGWPRLGLLGNTTGFQLREGSTDPNGNDPLVRSDEFIDCGNELTALGAGGNGTGLGRFEFNRLNKWCEFLACDPLGYSSCWYPICNPTNHDQFAI